MPDRSPRTRRFSPVRDLPAVVWLLAVVALALLLSGALMPRNDGAQSEQAS